MRAVAPAVAALGDEVVDAAHAVFISGIPVLHRGILDFRVFHGDEFHYGGMQLVFIPHGGGAAFQVADETALVRDDEGAFELAGLRLVDAEIGGQFHGAAHALGDVHEGAIAEHRRVQGGEIVVRVGHHGTQVFLYQLRVFMHGFRYGTENHPHVRQLLAEGGGHGDAVEYRVHRHAGQGFLLLQGNTQFLISGQQFRVHLIKALGTVTSLFWGGKVGNSLEIDGIIAQMGPIGFFHLQPVTIGLEAVVQHPLRFVLFRGNEADGILVKAWRQGVRRHVGDETMFITGFHQVVHAFLFCIHIVFHYLDNS